MHFQDPNLPAQAGSAFGGATHLHAIGVGALVVTAALALLLPRRQATLPLILLLCFIPSGQRIVLVTIDFTFLRVLLGVVWLRLVLRRELRPLVWNHLDRAILVWAVVAVVTGWLLGGSLAILVNRLGYTLDGVGTYFLFRQLIRDHADLVAIATQFTICSFVVLVFFAVENRTATNVFSVFGGVPEHTEIRDGRVRCQGAFAHSILAGCFWACLIPYTLLRGWLGRGWVLPVAGVLAAVAIVALCASSTPLIGLFAGLLAGAAFVLRPAMRWIRWLVVLWVCVLHFLIMESPVWHLLARIDLVGGSTGWHRFILVDAFFERFDEWWLVGTMRTGHWGPGLQDITNQFVAEGCGGGIWRLAMFVTVIALAFAGVSRSLRVPAASRSWLFATWALGTALFMHCVNFVGVSYFEQIVVEWHLALAAVGSLTLVPGAPAVQQITSLAAGR